MAAKKRNSATDDGEPSVEVPTGTPNDCPKPPKKKPKNNKNNDDKQHVAASDCSVKPMERRKKRKALDKERRRTAATESEAPKKPNYDELKPETGARAQPVDSPGTIGGGATLPEFHIGVFEDLGAEAETARKAAANQMVTELKAIQNAYDALEEKAVGDGGFKLEAEKDDGLDDCAPSVRYAVRRLIRGVASSRECARQGFALGLTILAGTIRNIKIESFLKLVVDLLEVTSSMKGQEAKDCLLGRLFAYGALARSGRLTEEWNMDKNTPCIKEFITVLIALANKKRYLQDPAVSIILDLVEKLPVEAVLNHVIEAPGLKEWFEAATEIGNPDALLLALKLREKISVDKSVFGKLLPNPFSSSQLFSADHLSSLSNCLKESTFCQPCVHSVWPVLVNILLPNTIIQAEDAASASNSLKKHKKSRKSSSSDEEVAKNLQSFCKIIIEGSLLFSSHDQKHIAFEVLFLLLQKLSASLVPIVLSNKVVQCLMDILSTKDTWLYKVAHQFLKQLSDWVGDDDVRRVAVIVAIQKHSNGKFDSVTRMKTVKDFMSHFKTEPGCMLFIQNLMNLFVDEGNASEEPSDQSQTTDENSEIGSVEDKDSPRITGNSDYLKSWIIESLQSILKYLKFDHEEKFRVQKEIMKFLAVQGLSAESLGNEVTSFELQVKEMKKEQVKEMKKEQVKEMKKLENILFGSLYSPVEFGKEDNEVEAGNSKGLDLFFTDRSANSVVSVYEEDADFSEKSDDGGALQRKPVWVDEEEEQTTINIAKVNRLRKLRKEEEEDLISGSEYVSRLRAQHIKLNPGTDWAQRSTIDRSSDDEDSDEENEAVLSRAYEYVDDILRTNEDLVVKSNSKLLPGHVEYSRLVDANIQDPCSGPINSVQFHRNGQLLLAAGLDRKLRFFQIDGKRNAKIQSIFLEDCPIRKASFLPEGSQVILSGRRKFFYSFDLVKAKVDKIGPLVGREEKSLEVFEVSPNSQTIAFVGNQGYILLVSTKTKQLVGTLKMNGTARSLAFAEDGHQLLSGGGDGQIYHWDLRTMTCMHKGVDEGCINSTTLCSSPGGTHFAAGSDSGIVNIYNREEFLGGKRKPIKTIENLTTKVDFMKFNHDSQMLAICSSMKKSSLKLIHIPSYTVFSNWPAPNANLHYAHCMDFSPGGGFMAVGNAAGKVLLYKLHHYHHA